MTNEVKPYTDEELEELRKASRSHWKDSHVLYHVWTVRRLLATLDERTRERDEARADAVTSDGLESMAREEAERMLASACDLRDALDSVAGHLGVDTSTDAETEARACVEAIAALREEVERLRQEDDAPALPSQEQPATPAWLTEAREDDVTGVLASDEPPKCSLCGHPVNWHWSARGCSQGQSAGCWCPGLVVASPPTSTLDQSEGEPTVTVTFEEDDADPTKWQPGDVVQRLGPAEWTVLDVTKTQMLLGGPPLMPIWRTHEQISADGFRRIHRASTEERKE